MTRPIFLLTDFGLADTYVGVVKAVILGIAPDATLVDLTHEIPAQDVRAGAFALWTATPYLPADAVVLAVVDPGVGTSRRPIAAQSGGRMFVGPDNGLLSWALGDTLPHSEVLELSPPLAGVLLDRPEYWLPQVSSTFHGRDLFGPVAAHLARGVPLSEVGSPLEEITAIPFPRPRTRCDVDGETVVQVHGEVIHVDRYGNLITNLTVRDLPCHPRITIDGTWVGGLRSSYQEPASSGLLALIGSSGLLEIAAPNGSAADLLGAGVGTAVTVTPPRVV